MSSLNPLLVISPRSKPWIAFSLLPPSLTRAPSYEDTVGGVQADVVILFRPADVATLPAITALGATAPAANEGLASSLDGSIAGAAAVGGRKGAVLTIVIRPLPSTAPASLDSGSSRGGESDMCLSPCFAAHDLSCSVGIEGVCGGACMMWAVSVFVRDDPKPLDSRPKEHQHQHQHRHRRRRQHRHHQSFPAPFFFHLHFAPPSPLHGVSIYPYNKWLKSSSPLSLSLSPSLPTVSSSMHVACHLS